MFVGCDDMFDECDDIFVGSGDVCVGCDDIFVGCDGMIVGCDGMIVGCDDGYVFVGHDDTCNLRSRLVGGAARCEEMVPVSTARRGGLGLVLALTITSVRDALVLVRNRLCARINF